MIHSAHHLVTLDALTDETLQSLIVLALRIAENRAAYSTALEGNILATMFLEPSTRTRLSFESAMLRLGGRVITMADASNSSVSKGETLSDTVRVVDRYADALVLRHPRMGAARCAARLSRHPVLNAGDGGHEHPTQALTDLVTLAQRGRSLTGGSFVFLGDLRHGRTVASLARALLRLGGRVLFVPEPGLAPTAGLLSRVVGAAPDLVQRVVEVGDLTPSDRRFDALWVGPRDRAPTREEFSLREDPPIALYATRLQRERFAPGETAGGGLPPIDRAFLEAPALAHALLLHPLPRVDEIRNEVDSDPRAAYFDQVAAGVDARMAVLLWCFGRTQLLGPLSESGVSNSDRVCENRACVAHGTPPEVPSEVLLVAADIRLCAWCHQRVP